MFAYFPSVAQTLLHGEIIVDGVSVYDTKSAEQLITDDSKVYLGPGEYTRGLHIKANNVILSGSEGTHFIGAAILGKGAIVTSGNNITIENIECSGIKVSSGNGSCIRHEGENLTVKWVYFHDSQEGILENQNDGFLHIKHSRFERLGYNGRAHGVYTNGAELLIEDSTFTSTHNQGHSVKSRSAATVIKNTLIANYKGNDSRAIDISDAGEFSLLNSIVYQSDYTVNRQVIGYGLEKMPEERNNTVNIQNNLIVMERLRGNEVIGFPKGFRRDNVNIRGNVLVGEHYDSDDWQDTNTFYKNRKEASLSENILPRVKDLPQVLVLLTK